VRPFDQLTASDRSLLGELMRRVEESGDHPALPDPQRRALTETRGTPPEAEGTAFFVREGGGLTAAAVLTHASDDSAVLHVLHDPGGPEARATVVLAAALASVPDVTVHLWALHAEPADDRRAAVLGFAPEREVVQMRIPLPLPPAVAASARPLVTRAFVKGQDEAAWLETNNRAFAGHPEQGGWTISQLEDRLAADWVDLDGFLVADDPDGPGLIGSCWTKIHRGSTPVLGEIYVIAVDPNHHGEGWGRSLTVAGLTHLAERGVRDGMLYTESDNTAALGLYESLGFVVDHVDRSYLRRPRGGSG
jgi:mycothiol synthase